MEKGLVIIISQLINIDEILGKRFAILFPGGPKKDFFQ
jgi:hypothetical protein